MSEPWIFDEEKAYILKNCSVKGWADDDDTEPILESTIDKAIEIALSIKKYYQERNLTIEKPMMNQCGDGSMDLDFASWEGGYSILLNYHPEEGISVYGDNEQRNWKNRDRVELRFDNSDSSRAVLGTFARWCYENVSKRVKDCSPWSIEVQQKRKRSWKMKIKETPEDFIEVKKNE